jgi:hypothetical protein
MNTTKIKELAAALWDKIRKAPIAAYIKPLWKGGLKSVIQSEGDRLQALVRNEVAKDLHAAQPAVNHAIDQAQKSLLELSGRLPMPAQFRIKVQAFLGEGIDKLQQRLNDALFAGSLGAVNGAIDKAFDEFQKKLIERIDAL